MVRYGLPVQPQRFAFAQATSLFVPSKNSAALLVQRPSVNQIVDPLAWSKGRVQLDLRLWPEHAIIQTPFDMCSDPLVPNLNGT